VLLILNWRTAEDSAVTLAALQALTNLAVTPLYHNLYVNHVDTVSQLALSSSVNSDVRLQALRLLVNLTASDELAQRLLDIQVRRKLALHDMPLMEHTLVAHYHVDVTLET
jgi:Armadillo-like